MKCSADLTHGAPNSAAHERPEINDASRGNPITHHASVQHRFQIKQVRLLSRHQLTDVKAIRKIYSEEGRALVHDDRWQLVSEFL